MRDGGIIHPPPVEVEVVLDALLTRPPTTATTTIRATVVEML